MATSNPSASSPASSGAGDMQTSEHKGASALPKVPAGQHEILTPGPVFNPDGTLREPGFARSLILDYDHDRIKASKLRLKEWDYYLVNDGHFALCMTIADCGYIGMISASVVDFDTPRYKTTSEVTVLPLGRFDLPKTSVEGVTAFHNKRVDIVYDVTAERRVLDLDLRSFDGDQPLTAHVVLDQIPRDSMVIATPWKGKPKAFYYNQKIVGMRAEGSFDYGELHHEFSREDSFGLLDWGRGAWTYDNKWFWGVAQGKQNGHVAAFNIGYGFGDTSAASENMFSLDGICHKLDQIDFGIGETAKGELDLMHTWHMTSNDGRFELDFEPFIDRADHIKVGPILSDQHQVYGLLNGTVVLDDGAAFPIRDLHGSAEVVHNKW